MLMLKTHRAICYISDANAISIASKILDRNLKQYLKKVIMKMKKLCYRFHLGTVETKEYINKVQKKKMWRILYT